MNDKCPLGWIEIDEKCFHIPHFDATMNEAVDECIRLGAKLVEPQSKEQVEKIITLIKNHFGIDNNVRIGILRKGDTNEYVLFSDL